MMIGGLSRTNCWVALPIGYSGKFKGLDRWIESDEFELITKETPKAKATKLLRRFQDLTLDWFSGETKRRPGAGKRLSEKGNIFGAMPDVDDAIKIPGSKADQALIDEATELEELRKLYGAQLFKSYQNHLR